MVSRSRSSYMICSNPNGHKNARQRGEVDGAAGRVCGVRNQELNIRPRGEEEGQVAI